MDNQSQILIFRALLLMMNSMDKVDDFENITYHEVMQDIGKYIQELKNGND
jgi:hypothetical protein